MTAGDLIAEARQNRIAPTRPDCFEPTMVAWALGFILEHVLADIDYERDRKCGCAIAARMIAALITNAEDLAEGKNLKTVN